MMKKTNNKKRGRTTTAGRKVTLAKRRARVAQKELGAKNYVLEPHPEL